MANADELAGLEQELALLSHGTEALDLLRAFLKRLGKVAARQRFLADRMLCSPIAYEDVRRRVDVEPFHLLQGDVLFNVARLDPFAQCSNEALSLAARRASMTLIGWRVFGAVLRNVQVREAEGEAELRTPGA